MVAMPPDITPELAGDWEWVTTRLAAMEPLHRPGEANAYHAQSFGWLIGEVVRQTDPVHRIPCQFLRDEVFSPFGIDNIYIPLPPEQDDRVATLTTAGTAQPDFSGARFRGHVDATWRGARSRRVQPGRDAPRLQPVGRRDRHHRDVARFFAILANGGTLDGTRLLSESRVRSLLEVRPHNDRIDEVGGARTSVGIGGLWVRDPEAPDGPDASGLPPDVLGSSPDILYHTGAGGTIAFADLDRRIAVAICHNRMFGSLPIGQHPWVDVAAAVWDTIDDHASS